MRRDCRNYYFSDYEIENIQYELELDKPKCDKERQ